MFHKKSIAYYLTKFYDRVKIFSVLKGDDKRHGQQSNFAERFGLVKQTKLWLMNSLFELLR